LNRVVRIRQFVLQPGRRFDQFFSIAWPPRRSSMRLTATLYRQDRPQTAYRYVVVRLRAGAQPSV
jgi:hypothetical protein